MDPNDLGRMTEHETPLTEVGILRDNGEPMSERVIPDDRVVRGVELDLS